MEAFLTGNSNFKPVPEQTTIHKQQEYLECAVMLNKRAESGTVPQLIKHNCLFRISCAKTAAHQKHRKTMAQQRYDLHAPGGRRRVLTSNKQTRSSEKHRKTTPHGCTSRKRSVPIVRRKEVADQSISPVLVPGGAKPHRTFQRNLIRQ